MSNDQQKQQQQTKSINELNGDYKLKYSHKDNYGARYFKIKRLDYMKIKKYQKDNGFSHSCTHKYERDGEFQHYIKIKNPADCLIKKKGQKREDENIHLVFYPWSWEKEENCIDDVMKGIRAITV